MGNETSQQTQGGTEIPNDMHISWTKSTNDLPARDGHCACGVADRMYVFGGVVATADGGFDESNDMLMFDSGLCHSYIAICLESRNTLYEHFIDILLY